MISLMASIKNRFFVIPGGLKLGVEMFCAYLNQHGKW